LFYADADGHPGADLTFFPWAHLAPPRPGHGTAPEVSLEIPRGAVEFWGQRLQKYGAQVQSREMRFGDTVVPVTDPHGLRLALVEPAAAPSRLFTPWGGGPVQADRQIRGLYGAQIWVRDAAATTSFLTGTLGFRHRADENGVSRYGFENSAGVIDVRATPELRRGAWGVGAVHHLAWRVDDEQHQLNLRGRVEEAGRHPTPVIDRFWFKSVYFQEPGGVLFELATDGPGFAVDEDPARLGETLVLPPWLEPARPRIEEALPVLKLPAEPAPDR
jgi:glyoxalase family protein